MVGVREAVRQFGCTDLGADVDDERGLEAAIAQVVQRGLLGAALTIEVRRDQQPQLRGQALFFGVEAVLTQVAVGRGVVGAADGIQTGLQVRCHSVFLGVSSKQCGLSGSAALALVVQA